MSHHVPNTLHLYPPLDGTPVVSCTVSGLSLPPTEKLLEGENHEMGLQDRVKQTFYTKGQIVNTTGFAYHIWSPWHILAFLTTL